MVTLLRDDQTNAPQKAKEALNHEMPIHQTQPQVQHPRRSW